MSGKKILKAKDIERLENTSLAGPVGNLGAATNQATRQTPVCGCDGGGVLIL